MPEDEAVPASIDPIAWYDPHASEVVNRYEVPAPEKINDWYRAFLPGQPGFILDVGAGSGRDAAWLASLGHEVIAVEPRDQLRARARELHAGASGITRIDDRLPGLEKVHRLAVSFDFILLNAVWMHVPPASRQRASRKLITLLKPGGRLAISFRQPDRDRARPMLPCHLMSSRNSPGIPRIQMTISSQMPPVLILSERVVTRMGNNECNISI